MWHTRSRCILAGLLSCLSFARLTFGFQQDAKSTDPQVAASSIAGSVNAVTGDGQMTTLLPNSYDNCESFAFDNRTKGLRQKKVLPRMSFEKRWGKRLYSFGRVYEAWFFQAARVVTRHAQSAAWQGACVRTVDRPSSVS